MWFVHQDFSFELNDEWWAEAGMCGFVPASQSYRVASKSFPERNHYEVRIDEVAPVRRQLSHGVFNNDEQTGLPAKNRVINILRAFVSGVALPPIEIVRLPQGALHSHRLVHGAHRFYLSVAAGFTHVPCVDGFEV